MPRMTLKNQPPGDNCTRSLGPETVAVDHRAKPFGRCQHCFAAEPQHTLGHERTGSMRNPAD